MLRYRLIRSSLRFATRIYSRVRVEGLENMPAGPAIFCFSHQNWADPLYLFGWLPGRSRLYFFGPEQEDSLVFSPAEDEMADEARQVALGSEQDQGIAGGQS